MIIHKSLKDFFQIPSTDNVFIIPNPSPSEGNEFIFGYSISKNKSDEIKSSLQDCVGCMSVSDLTESDNILLKDISNIKN